MKRNSLPDFWQNEINNTLDLSELWAFVNITGGFNDRCNGGDSSLALNWLLQFAESVELERNYPYNDPINNY